MLRSHKFLCITAFLLAITFTVNAQSGQPQRPKLVVGLVVDQMRWDYLYRYYDRYGSNGFKRLLNQGFKCEQAYINYLPSYTGPGHACIYTGTVPSVHGIAGNDWIDNPTGIHCYCTEDTVATPIGGSWSAGRMSPRNLLSSTITDELMLATRSRSKVIGIAMKDRGSIIPAGHLGKAYWFDDSTGNFITSNYYGSQLPDWLVAFNQRRLSDSLITQPWTMLYDKNSYKQSLPDNNPWEGAFKGEQQPVFPHNPEKRKGYGLLRRMPSGNTITLEAAKAALHGAALGKGPETDFLCISLSSTDYIGHQFGPDAMETEDMYLRLDKELASFLQYLDRHLGKGNYLFFLTADHGGAHNAGYLQEIGIPAGNIEDRQFRAMVTEAADEALTFFPNTKLNSADLIESVENYQIYLNQTAIAEVGADEALLRKQLRKALEKHPLVAYVVDMDEVGNAAVPRHIREMIINGYHRLRSGDLQVIFHPGYYNGYGTTGTTHGTWHPYDTHLPLLWYGWGIPKGATYRKVHMEDIAPTLAALLNIQVPNGCVGEVITEILQKD